MIRPNFYTNWEWWLSRIQTEEHQAMYDKVASFIPLKRQDVFLEIGTGTGELLKRLVESGAKLYGTEASSELLEEAVINLESSGLSVIVKESKDMGLADYRSENKNRDRICLLNDDITNSNLRGNFTYAAVVLQQVESDIVTIKRLWAQSAYNHIIPWEAAVQDPGMICNEELLRVLGQVLPQGRKYLSADYITKNEFPLEMFGLRKIAKGFKIARQPEFVLSPEIYVDTGETHAQGGYRLVELQKT